MYQNRNNNFRRPNFHRGSGRSNFRRIKTFDPTSVVERAVSVEKEEVYVPVNTFDTFAVSDFIKQNIAARGFKTPTPIQDQAIPELLKGRDLIGIADTGTGKTAAFLIPLVEKTINDRNQKVLIITPTRELAAQIERELKIFTGNSSIRSVLCTGGVGLHGQIRTLERSPQFIIGTPGRLKDLEQRRYINFSAFQTIVLDEVDRMLDMGFVHEMEYVITKLPQNRQSLFFSATTNPSVETIMRRFVKDPVSVTIKSRDTLSNITQQIIRTNGQSKLTLLDTMLRQEGFEKVLVFGRTKRNVENIARELESLGVRTTSIHGNKSQHQRNRALDEFKSNRVQVMIATDVASRGIDVNDITHVINFDLPESYEDYIHRIGRTGRANKTGFALTFVD